MWDEYEHQPDETEARIHRLVSHHHLDRRTAAAWATQASLHADEAIVWSRRGFSPDQAETILVLTDVEDWDEWRDADLSPERAVKCVVAGLSLDEALAPTLEDDGLDVLFGLRKDWAEEAVRADRRQRLGGM